MYSDKENINILTSLLKSHGVKHIVVCPGSRNGALVHNFHVCPDFVCHPVTDERSAGFFALGIRQTLREMVAVCVTSGSALLNVLPAAAEATYRHQGIIVISADRPAAWIGQLDGQTMPQEGALGKFTPYSTTLPEPHDEEERWMCRRLVNEALMEAERPSHPSVHINVPISEPLFNFTCGELIPQPMTRRIFWQDPLTREEAADRMLRSAKPMIIIGQLPYPLSTDSSLRGLSRKIAVLAEPTAADTGEQTFTEEMLLSLGEDIPEEYRPDCVIYLGGNTVSKRLRSFLRDACRDAFHFTVSVDGTLHDISCHTDIVIEGYPEDVLGYLDGRLAETGIHSDFRLRWDELRTEVRARHNAFIPPYSQMAAVRQLEKSIRKSDTVHYANSMAVRLGSIFSSHHIWCNRGLNGIEGTLSTAAGASVALSGNGTDGHLFCVIGDLSFFYDENALWSREPGGNLRILLLNNSGGGIFGSLPGLRASPAAETLISASHHLSAEGICSQFGITYLKAADVTELDSGIQALVGMKSDRPVLLEVVTDAETDRKACSDYMKFISNPTID